MSFKHDASCKRCGVVFQMESHDSYVSEDKLDFIDQLCESCQNKFSDELQYSETQFVGNNNIKVGMTKLLEGLEEEFGLNWKEDENFKGTPERIARSYIEKCRGINSAEKCSQILDIGFPSDYKGMIVVPGVRVYSLCPHHFENVVYSIDIGYYPKSKVVGLSKLSRVAMLYGAQPILHETLVKDLVSIYQKGLDAEGVIVRATGQHGCMTSRGIKQPGSCAVMVDYSGCFASSPSIPDLTFCVV
jgi:GTP cyclohydrolase I